MAFIRRVKTTSGATAVQVAEYRDGRQRIVKHVGSAHSEVDLGVLMELAEQWLVGPDQEVFDLDVPRARRVLTPISERSSHAELFAPTPPPPRTDAPGRLRSTCSRLLFDVLAAVYADLGFGIVDDEVFCDLVIARIAEPTSLLDSGRVLCDLGRRRPGYATMKRPLQRVTARGYRELLTGACLAHVLAHGDLSLVLYDVTTLYFEAEKEDGLRKVGYSKERRVDPQIVVGLLVDRGGFPLEIGCFCGNKAETKTILPIVSSFLARHDIADLVVVADAGMLSGTNLAELDRADVRFIVGSRATKAPGDLESHFRWHGTTFSDGQVIDTITPRSAHGEPENNPMRRAEPVWDRETHPRSWRAVWAYSHKRAVRDRRTLALQEQRARAVVAGERAARTPRFVKTTAAGRHVDEASLARAQMPVGLKGYVTNIPVTTMPADQVISSYHDLWHVEQSFRMSKTDLAARPMFVRSEHAIEAHLTIVFAALAVAREVQRRSGVSIQSVCRQLRPLRTGTVAINGAVQTFPPEIHPDQQALIDSILRNASRALGK